MFGVQRIPRKLFGLLITLSAISILLGISFPVHARAALDVVVHFVEGNLLEGQLAYEVQAYFSVYDVNGNVISDLEASSVSVTEDSQKVEISSLDEAGDTPISVILLVDTSGSMRGSKIINAKKGGERFISLLGEDDQVAIYSFHDETNLVTDFTRVHQEASDGLSQIEAKSNSGTCLYDTAYEAVQVAATVPSGRRAVILLTDGVDEKADGSVCSVQTLEDVINAASEGNTRVPFYSIGLGTRVDEKGLARLSAMTGGLYLFSSSDTQLDGLFEQLSGQIKSQYVLKYVSGGAPGSHTVVVTVDREGQKGQDARSFLLPALPTRLTLLSPAEGQQVNGVVKVVASLSGQGETVDQVILEVNGILAGTDASTPYEFTWDPGANAAGAQEIVVIAQGKGGVEITRSSVTVLVVAPSAVQPTGPPTVLPTEEELVSGKLPSAIPMWAVGIGSGVLIVLVVIVVFISIASRKKTANRKEIPDSVRNTSSVIPPNLEVTMDFMVGAVPAFGEVYATLTVLGSDDTVMLGKVLNITKSPSRLGRSAECDIILPKDNPVSRMHALIERIDNQVIIREILTPDASGNPKKPTYGTFVNGKKVEEETVVLKTGDLLQIGPRVKFRFDLVSTTLVLEEKTYDHFTPGDSEAPDAGSENGLKPSVEAADENTQADVDHGDPDKTLQDANIENIDKPDDPATLADTDKTELD